MPYGPRLPLSAALTSALSARSAAPAFPLHLARAFPLLAGPALCRAALPVVGRRMRPGSISARVRYAGPLFSPRTTDAP